jgi:hypothetical protein
LEDLVEKTQEKNAAHSELQLFYGPRLRQEKRQVQAVQRRGHASEHSLFTYY